MTSVDLAARLRQLEGHLAGGRPEAALSLVSCLIRDGAAGPDVFDRFRHAFKAACGRDVPHAQIFDFIYACDAWEGGSGAGSLPQSTVEYRHFLQTFMARKHVRSVVDIGCGDWQSSRLIDWSAIDYLGIDVSSVVLRGTMQYARPGIRFLEGDAREMELPAADLLLVKDVLQHWSNADVHAIIPKFRHYRYCLITNGATAQVRALVNVDLPAGSYRPVDLSRAPFSVPGTFVLDYEVPYSTRADGAVCSAMRTFLVDRNDLVRSGR